MTEAVEVAAVAVTQMVSAQIKEQPDTVHGYGETSDCLCGRNFPTVRGLREHLTKSRQAEQPR